MTTFAALSVPLLIEKGSVVHYGLELTNRDGTLYKGNRFFVVLNVNPKTDEVLVLVTITSKTEKQEKHIKLTGEDATTLVRISPADLSFLSGDSAINCNNTYPTSLNELVKKIENGGKIYSEKVPNDILNALTSGVLKSNRVPPSHKKLVI